MKKTYGFPMAGIDTKQLCGPLIVIEGADGSGRSTHIQLLTDALERRGHGVVDAGLLCSELVSTEFGTARQGNLLGPLTRGLFYVTDLADQLEKRIVPALRSGMVVLADRYIYTLIARDLCRGADLDWLRGVFGFALVPDAVVYLEVSPERLARRVLSRDGALDYWEAGMDLGLHRSRYDSFVRYQLRLAAAYDQIDEHFGFRRVDAERPIETVHEELLAYIESVVPQLTSQ